MLNLTRAPGETVIIRNPDGTEIAITVISYSRGVIKLEFDAPRTVHIDREEIYRKKKESGFFEK